ncbi:MAG: hypothetical protein QXO17_03685 [Nitrososphaerota archaeon]
MTAVRLKPRVRGTFADDVAVLREAVRRRYGEGVARALEGPASKLLELHSRGIVKTNHSVLELICAAHLISMGYEVDVERQLEGPLVCDVYGVKGGGTIVVEIETGFTSPEHALDPLTYLRARIASKVARYSRFADRFCLATPRNNLLEIHSALIKPPAARTRTELERLKALCDLYYTSPPVTMEELRNCRLHSVMVIDVDDLTVQEFSPEEYREMLTRCGLSEWDD